MSYIISAIRTKLPPLSKDVIFIKLLDYVEKLIRNVFPHVKAYFRGLLQRLLERFCPKLAGWISRTVVRVDTTKYLDHVVSRASLALFDDNDEVVTLAYDGETLTPVRKYGRERNGYIGSVLVTHYPDVMLFQGYSTETNVLALRFAKLLEQHAAVPCVYDIAYDDKPRYQKAISTAHFIVPCDWDEKLAKIRRAIESDHGATTFVCVGPPGAGKTSFVNYVACTLRLSVVMLDRIEGAKNIKSKAILLIDDLDKRGKLNVAKLLNNCNGMQTNREHMYILNVNDEMKVDQMYPTLLREGRSIILRFETPKHDDLVKFNNAWCRGTLEIIEGETYAQMYERFMQQQIAEIDMCK